MHNFKKLIVWQKAREFSKNIDVATASFSTEEMHGIISQLRRASVSASSNIAEGAGRGLIRRCADSWV